jgi:hypothetical protein
VCALSDVLISFCILARNSLSHCLSSILPVGLPFVIASLYVPHRGEHNYQGCGPVLVQIMCPFH